MPANFELRHTSEGTQLKIGELFQTGEMYFQVHPLQFWNSALFIAIALRQMIVL